LFHDSTYEKETAKMTICQTWQIFISEAPRPCLSCCSGT